MSKESEPEGAPRVPCPYCGKTVRTKKKELVHHFDESALSGGFQNWCLGSGQPFSNE